VVDNLNVGLRDNANVDKVEPGGLNEGSGSLESASPDAVARSAVN
jgi:hypothetical protein